MKLNLQANGTAQEHVKAYLEANASPMLAEKINNGVRVQKDGKTLLNQKTLDGFMKFACEEAKKQSKKGAQSACIEDTVVYGWAIHYFEESEITETLYNEDGTPYKKQSSPTVKAPTAKYEPPKSNPKPQISLFDFLGSSSDVPIQEDIPKNEPTEENYREADEDDSILNADPETGEILTEEEMREFDGDIDEHIPTVSDILDNYSSDHRKDEILAKQINAVLGPEEDNEDDLDLSAFDAEAVAILSEIFGDELELR